MQREEDQSAQSTEMHQAWWTTITTDSIPEISSLRERIARRQKRGQPADRLQASLDAAVKRAQANSPPSATLIGSSTTRKIYPFPPPAMK